MGCEPRNAGGDGSGRGWEMGRESLTGTGSQGMGKDGSGREAGAGGMVGQL